MTFIFIISMLSSHYCVKPILVHGGAATTLNFKSKLTAVGNLSLWCISLKFYMAHKGRQC